jgi:hypothetical protein
MHLHANRAPQLNHYTRQFISSTNQKMKIAEKCAETLYRKAIKTITKKNNAMEILRRS